MTESSQLCSFYFHEKGQDSYNRQPKKLTLECLLGRQLFMLLHLGFTQLNFSSRYHFANQAVARREQER